MEDVIQSLQDNNILHVVIIIPGMSQRHLACLRGS